MTKVFLISQIREKNAGILKRKNATNNILKELVMLILLQVLIVKETSITQLTKELTTV